MMPLKRELRTKNDNGGSNWGCGGRMEKLVTLILRGVAFLPVYTAIVVTITLIVAIWGPAFGGK